MSTSDTLFDPTIYSTYSTMAQADTTGSTSTDSSYDRISDLLEGGDTGSNVTDTPGNSGDHEDCPCGERSSCEGCTSTIEQPAQTARSQVSEHTATRHDTHSDEEIIPEANSVRNGKSFKVLLMLLLVLHAARGNVWVIVTGIAALVLWYGLRVLRRASDDAAERQINSFQPLDQSWKDKGPMKDVNNDFGCLP